MRKLLLLAGSLVGFGLITGSVTQGSPTLAGPGTIRITTREVEVRMDDRGAPGRSAGDVMVIRQLLYNKSIKRTPIGTTDVVCTYTSSSARQCSGTYDLPRGKIVVAGSIRFREFYKLAVIGGTEIYNNVRGTMSATRYGRNPRRELLIFRLVV
jgi:hypothetical protein